MKLETLIKRYSKLGYKPKNLDVYLEIESINNWLFKKNNWFGRITRQIPDNEKDYGELFSTKKNI